jgi:hypothetical protein
MIMVLHILIFNEECFMHVLRLSQPMPAYNSSVITYSVLSLTQIYVSSRHHTIVFKHPVALIYHLFHTIYFCLQCNLLLSPFLLTTHLGRICPSSDDNYTNILRNYTITHKHPCHCANKSKQRDFKECHLNE